MKYLLMICADESLELTPEEQRGLHGTTPNPGERRWTRRGVWREGDRLRPVSDATTVRVRDAEMLIADGPFAETKEQIAGFDILECADLDEAIEIGRQASRSPASA